jgi:hypothetical protein
MKIKIDFYSRIVRLSNDLNRYYKIWLGGKDGEIGTLVIDIGIELEEAGLTCENCTHFLRFGVCGCNISTNCFSSRHQIACYDFEPKLDTIDIIRDMWSLL